LREGTGFRVEGSGYRGQREEKVMGDGERGVLGDKV